MSGLTRTGLAAGRSGATVVTMEAKLTHPTRDQLLRAIAAMTEGDRITVVGHKDTATVVCEPYGDRARNQLVTRYQNLKDVQAAPHNGTGDPRVGNTPYTTHEIMRATGLLT